MEGILKLWFADGRIYILTTDNRTLSQPLELFPTLKDATSAQRADYVINKWGDAIRWAEIDEDIHISSFFESVEPQYDNEVARLFALFPQLNVSEVARSLGIHKSLLSQYIYGVKNPSEKRLKEIKSVLHTIGMELIAATA